MDGTTQKYINSPAMWIFALIIIGLAIMQSVILYRYARKYIRRTHLLTKGEVKTCFRTGGIVAIGPALSAFVISLSMISLLGAPFTLMRVGMIGSPATELTAATVGAEAAGVTLGVDALTPKAFTAALWVCAIMSSGYLIFVPMVTRGVGKAINNVIIPPEGQKPSWLAWVLSGLLPFLIFLVLSIVQATKSTIHLITMIVSAAMMAALNLIAMKFKKKWLTHWSICIAVLTGIIVGGVLKAITG